jgi:hypothetical protein
MSGAKAVELLSAKMAEPLTRKFHTRGGSAGFQTCERPERFDTLPIWKSAIQQVWKPALRRVRPTVENECEISGLTAKLAGLLTAKMAVLPR